MGSGNKDQILRGAERFVLQGRLASAVNEYLKILESEPDDPVLLNTVGDLLLRLKKNAEAINYFHRAADLYLSQGFTLKAIATLKKVFHLTPENLKVQETLAGLYQRQDLCQDAAALYKAVGRRLLHAGKEREAAEIFEKVVELDKDDVETLEYLAAQKASRGDKEEACSLMKRAGAVCLEQNCPERALDLLRRGLDLLPEDPELMDLFATAARVAGHALPEDTRGRERGPQRGLAPPEDLQGSLQEVDFYLKLAFCDEARALLEQLDARYPGSEQVRHRLQEATAAGALERAMPAGIPRDLEAPAGPPSADLALDRIDEVINSLFESAGATAPLQAAGESKTRQAQVPDSLAVSSRQFDTHVDLATAYREIGLLQDAIEELLQAIHCADNGSDDHQTALCCSLLANCYLEAGQPDRAVHWAQRGLELRETRPYERATLLYGLARALEAQGYGEDALQRYNEIGEIIQNFRDISERVSRLGGCARQTA